MNQFLKVFLISLLIFSLVVGTGIFTYARFFEPVDLGEETPNGGSEIEDDGVNDYDTPLEKAMKRSKRINVLLLGLEGTRSDTIMIASYDRLNKVADIISVPRDTYYYREGYGKYSEFMKVNAIYGTDDQRQNALMDAVEEITGIPIDKYVSIDYAGVRAAVDAVGGVEVDVPFHMKYYDPYDVPPLRINIPAGRQVLYGDEAIQFLRYRSGYPEGDVGRVKAQQEFMKAAISKALSLKLPAVISSIYPHVKTNFSLTELLGLAGDAIGFSTDNLTTQILPGVGQYLGGTSFYLVDEEETVKLLYDLYGVPMSVEDVTDDTDDTEYKDLETKE